MPRAAYRVAVGARSRGRDAFHLGIHREWILWGVGRQHVILTNAPLSHWRTAHNLLYNQRLFSPATAATRPIEHRADPNRGGLRHFH